MLTPDGYNPVLNLANLSSVDSAFNYTLDYYGYDEVYGYELFFILVNFSSTVSEFHNTEPAYVPYGV